MKPSNWQDTKRSGRSAIRPPFRCRIRPYTHRPSHVKGSDATAPPAGAAQRLDDPLAARTTARLTACNTACSS
jgi:hypothetical protein